VPDLEEADAVNTRPT